MLSHRDDVENAVTTYSVNNRSDERAEWRK